MQLEGLKERNESTHTTAAPRHHENIYYNLDTEWIDGK